MREYILRTAHGADLDTIEFKVIAVSPEMAEAKIKSLLSKLLRNFPTGGVLEGGQSGGLVQDSWQSQFLGSFGPVAPQVPAGSMQAQPIPSGWNVPANSVPVPGVSLSGESYTAIDYNLAYSVEVGQVVGTRTGYIGTVTAVNKITGEVTYRI